MCSDCSHVFSVSTGEGCCVGLDKNKPTKTLTTSIESIVKLLTTTVESRKCPKCESTKVKQTLPMCK